MSSPKTTKCSFNRSESLLIIKKLLDVFMSHVSGFFLSTNMHLTSPEPLYIPACCVEKKNKKTKNQLFITEHKLSLQAFSVFYFMAVCSTWSGIHKLQSCLENQLKTIRSKTSSIPVVFSWSHWLCLITWLQHLKCSLSPRALPRSAISDSFLLPVRENAREVQRAPCPAPSAGNLTASREGAE